MSERGNFEPDSTAILQLRQAGVGRRVEAACLTMVGLGQRSSGAMRADGKRNMRLKQTLVLDSLSVR